MIKYLIFFAALFIGCKQQALNEESVQQVDFAEIDIQLDTTPSNDTTNSWSHPVEVAPKLDGNLDSLSRGLNRRLENLVALDGKVIFLQLLVDESGNSSEFEILKPDIEPQYRDSIFNYLQGLHFTPGTLNGKPVKARMVLPLYF